MNDPDDRWKDGIERDLAYLRGAQDGQRERLEKLDERQGRTESFQKWVTGGVGFAMWFVGVFSDKLRHLFGGP